MTSYSLASQVEWPFMTLPDFPRKGLALRQQADVSAFGYLPVVQGRDRDRWEQYIADNKDWVREAKEWEQARRNSVPSSSRQLSSDSLDQNVRQLENVDFSNGVANSIFRMDQNGNAIIDDGTGPFAPVWMTSPAPRGATNINYNMLSHQHLWEEIEVAIESEQAVMSKVLNLDEPHDSILGEPTTSIDPVSAMYYPVFDNFDLDRSLVGLLAAEMEWKYFLDEVLPSNAVGVIAVVENACQQAFTYRIDGPKAVYLGANDFHDASFDDLVESRSMSFFSATSPDFIGSRLNFEPCPFSLRVYPSHILEDSLESNQAVLCASSILALFFISAAIFYIYDNISNNRKSHDDQSVVVLERMFAGDKKIEPSLKDRVMGTLNTGRPGSEPKPSAGPANFKATIQSFPGFLGKNTQEDSLSDATILFADIYGLEAWSAGKDVDERANLLDVVYRTFTLVGKKSGIRQIEMTKDCFVAIRGPKHSETDHAEAVVRFACECRKRLAEAFKNKGAKGLAMRFGIHSGHVQTGAFGDDNSKYQLFGDTVDTTYDMLSHSRPGKVHLSVETAELLNLEGRGDWLVPREDLVTVKGRGAMSTFWIKPKACLADEPKDTVPGNSSTAASETSVDDVDTWEAMNVSEKPSSESKIEKVTDAALEVLARYLKKVQAHRSCSGTSKIMDSHDSDLAMGNPIVDEAREHVILPPFDSHVVAESSQTSIVHLPEEVESQLRLYVSSIASTYRENEFHNVEHALHVTLTMDKMIKKIVSPEGQDMMVDFGGKPRSAEKVVSDLDSRTFGLASDPLSQFALVIGSFVHDVDHVGVSNHQLVKEKSPVASLYKNKSVSEQNSVDIAWWLLMTPNFVDLRSAIYGNASEMQRFRQILVNGIIATDILDRDFKILRDKRWEKAFRKGRRDMPGNDIRNLQATMMIEHMLQAADHGHTMQSFRTYNKWSQRLFNEMYQAFHAGRAEKDPSRSWYVGELAFFDKFVIPLATRLRDSGAFGSTGDAYLNNAVLNRRLWASNGKSIVNELMENFNRKVVATQEDTIVFSYD